MAQPSGTGTWPAIDVLYGVQFDPLTDDTADGVAHAMIDYRYFSAGPAAYLDGIERVLAAGVPLTEALPTQHSEPDFRDFLGKVRDRLIDLRPWPEPAFRKLPAEEWRNFGDARPIARIPGLHHVTVAQRLPSMFDSVEAGQAKLPVLMLRLKSGAEVALMGPVDPKATGVTVLGRDGGDPAPVLGELRELLRMSPEQLVPLEG